MKTDSKINYFFILTLIAGMIIGALVFSSCTKIPDAAKDTITANVKVSLNYAFPSRTGDITAKGGSVYLDFYTKYIFGKILTPRTYYLEFDGIDNPNFMLAVLGKWANKDLISVPSGKYIIQGYSYPTIYNISGDTCYLKFYDTINVTETIINITLAAKYDCSLILLDITNTQNVQLRNDGNFVNGAGNWTYKSTMMKSEEFYHTFIRGKSITGVNMYVDLIITKEVPNERVTIFLWNYIWEAGKYYYFSNSDNNYTLSQFTNGN